MIHPTAPHYSLLIKFDPFDSTKIVPDLAESWTMSADRLTYTFKIRSGVKFHDGSALTSKDIKATYDKIITPKEGVVSARQASYSAVASVSTPDDATVVFALKRPSASMLQNLASPWNYIYSAKKLEEDPRWYEKNVMGTGPFVFTEYVRGDPLVGQTVRGLLGQGQAVPGQLQSHLHHRFSSAGCRRAQRAGDGRVSRLPADSAGRSRPRYGRRYYRSGKPVDLRPVGGAQYREKAVRRCTGTPCAVARGRPLGGEQGALAGGLCSAVGGIMRPGSQYAAAEPDLIKLLGFARDGNDSKTQARALLREAGVPDGFSFVLKNRNVPMPYEPVAVFLIDQWKKIGLNPTQQVLESAAWTNDLRAGNYRDHGRLQLRLHGRS